MFLTKLALKNLIRHKNRTFITSFIIAFAIFFYILLDSLIGGMTEMSYESIIDYQAGHMQLVNQEYWKEKDDLPLENLISLDDGITKKIKDLSSYRSYLEEINFQGRLNNGINELPVTAKGVKPDQLLKIFPIEDKFVNGSIFKMGEYKVVMGKRLADLMKLQVGDYITLIVKDKNDTFNTIDAEISGLIHTGNPYVNSSIVYVPLDIAQNALNLENEVSKIIIKLEDKKDSSMESKILEKSINEINMDLKVYAWNELEAVSVASAKQAGNKLIMVIILLIAAIAIINTVILGALERMEEIGMMKAMGLEEKHIVYTFVLESTGIGIIGGIMGLILGVIGTWILVNYGLDWNAIMDTDMSSFGIPVIGKMYGVWNLKSFLLVFLFGIIVSFLSSIPPAYWAAKKDPIKAIHHR